MVTNLSSMPSFGELYGTNHACPSTGGSSVNTVVVVLLVAATITSTYFIYKAISENKHLKKIISDNDLRI